VDLVLDTIGGETIQRSLEIIRPFGRLISIVNIAQAWARIWRFILFFTPVPSKIRRFDKTNRASSASPSDWFSIALGSGRSGTSAFRAGRNTGQNCAEIYGRLDHLRHWLLLDGSEFDFVLKVNIDWNRRSRMILQGKVALVTEAHRELRSHSVPLEPKCLLGHTRCRRWRNCWFDSWDWSECLFVKSDVSSEADVRELCRKRSPPTAGCAFNNAGIDLAVKPLHEQSIEDFDKIMSINARGYFSVWNTKFSRC